MKLQVQAVIIKEDGDVSRIKVGMCAIKKSYED